MTTDTVFAGPIPTAYDRYLGPMLFEPYAVDLAARLAATRARDVLETAAGTGIVTEAIVRALPEAHVTATDLNPAMLAMAERRVESPRVRFREANAQQLPFDDASFDAVVCQFGAMFFPDADRAYREARRVLRPGGLFLFNVWGPIAENPVTDVAAAAVAALFPADPPDFFARVPFGYHDESRTKAQLTGAGFANVRCETVVLRSRIGSARDAALGLCHGTPLRAEIEAHGAGALDRATDAAADAIVGLCGESVDAPMTARVFAAQV